MALSPKSVDSVAAAVSNVDPALGLVVVKVTKFKVVLVLFKEWSVRKYFFRSFLPM